MKIHSNGIQIHVHDSGDAGEDETVIVFLHYYGGSSRTWQRVTNALPAHYRTIATDHRGWGESDAGDGDYSIATLAADAQGVIDALGLKRYVLVGHSMGGKVAQWMASRRPDGLLGMVLVAPASPAPSAIPQAQREMMSHVYDTRESVLAVCEHVLTGGMLSSRDLEQVVEDSLRGTPAARLAWPMTTMMEDISAEAERIAVPVLVIGGEYDKVDPVATLKSEILARIKGASMHVIAGAGHLSPLEAPTEIATAISGFIEKL